MKCKNRLLQLVTIAALRLQQFACNFFFSRNRKLSENEEATIYR